MIEKPAIIITSLGRTGTKFFHTLFRATMPDGTALHEPDVLNFVQYQGRDERLRRLGQQIRESGFTNLFLRRVMGQWSLVRLSDATVKGQLGHDGAADALQRQRAQFINTRPGSIYVEANVGYYGLLHILPRVFAHHRAVYLVRDGRDWVRSNMNWGEMYGKGRWRQRLAHTWPTAADLPGDPYQAQWSTFSRFEKLCWAWARLNRFALDCAQQNPAARVVRFEDIFYAADREQRLSDLVSFLTDLPGVMPPAANALDGWLERQIHQSAPHFPVWSEWPGGQKEQFETLCSDVMRRLNYPWPGTGR